MSYIHRLRRNRLPTIYVEMRIINNYAYLDNEG
ncbi:hypothetical protein PHMEG_00019231 [Phytophthora megakarya]|uniref:Uncharacterized protein n=1 Tax=Phytophthora megakarya TaxID=4795 RepID=A0A225VSW4_9STRA|nr:hypothetical protein PHMEG_00019231 [Phytophthora megakarya]